MAAHTVSDARYYIAYEALHFTENYLDNINLVGVSLMAGTIVRVYDPTVSHFNTAADASYKQWNLQGYSTHLGEDSTNHRDIYVYIRIHKDNNATANIVFSSVIPEDEFNKLTDEQKEAHRATTVARGTACYYRRDEQNADSANTLTATAAGYHYIPIGVMNYSASSSTYSMTYDTGRLGTNAYQEDSSGEWYVADGNTYKVDYKTNWIFNIFKAVTYTIKKLIPPHDEQNNISAILTSDAGEIVEEGSNFKESATVVNIDTSFLTPGWIFGPFVQWLRKKFVRKDNPDGTEVILGGVEIKKDLTVGGDTTLNQLTSENIVNHGDISTKNLKVTGKAEFFELVIDKVAAAGGATLYTPADGFEVDKVVPVYLEAQGDASYATSLTNLQEITDAATLNAVYQSSHLGYKIYFKATDGDGKYIYNMWKAGDQAICYTFNEAKAGSLSSVSNKYWWSLVRSVNNSDQTETVDIGGTNMACHYIVVSAPVVSGAYNKDDDNVPVVDGTICSSSGTTVSCEIEVGDSIAMLGHRPTAADVDGEGVVQEGEIKRRGNAIYISAYSGLDNGYTDPVSGKVTAPLVAPFYAQYRGIRTFELARYRKTYFDASTAKFVGTFASESDNEDIDIYDLINKMSVTISVGPQTLNFIQGGSSDQTQVVRVAISKNNELLDSSKYSCSLSDNLTNKAGEGLTFSAPSFNAADKCYEISATLAKGKTVSVNGVINVTYAGYTIPYSLNVLTSAIQGTINLSAKNAYTQTEINTLFSTIGSSITIEVTSLDGVQDGMSAMVVVSNITTSGYRMLYGIISNHNTDGDGKHFVTFTLAGYTDGGAKGSDATSYVADLTNEMSGVACDKDLKPARSASASTTAKLLYGSTGLETTIQLYPTLASLKAYGITVNDSAGTIGTGSAVDHNLTFAIEEWGEGKYTDGSGNEQNKLPLKNPMEITITLTTTATPQQSNAVTFTLVPVEPGANGEPATLYDIIPDQDAIVFNKDENGVIDPSSTATLKADIRQTIGDSEEILSLLDAKLAEYGLYYQKNTAITTKPAEAYRFPTDGITVVPTDTRIYLALYKGETLVDKESVPIIKGGENGTGMITLTCTSSMTQDAMDAAEYGIGRSQTFVVYSVDGVKVGMSATVVVDNTTTGGYRMFFGSVTAVNSTAKSVTITITGFTDGGARGNDAIAYVTDLDNEMSGVACDDQCRPTMAAHLETKATMKYGPTPQDTTIQLYPTAATLLQYGITVKDNGADINATAVAEHALTFDVAAWGDGKYTVGDNRFDKISIPNPLEVRITLSTTVEGVSYNNSATFTIVPAQPGANGESPTILDIAPRDSSVVFSKQADGTIDTTAQTLYVDIRQTQGTTQEVKAFDSFAGYTLYYRKNAIITDSNKGTAYTSSGISVASTDTRIYLALYKGETLVDKESVPIIKDGSETTFYRLQCDNASTITRSSTGVNSPASLTIKIMKTVGTKTTKIDPSSDNYVYYYIDSLAGSPTKLESSSLNVSTAKSKVCLFLYDKAPTGGHTEYHTLTIGVVDNGKDSIRLELSSDKISFTSGDNGSISGSQSVTVKAYQGNTQLTMTSFTTNNTSSGDYQNKNCSVAVSKSSNVGTMTISIPDSLRQPIEYESFDDDGKPVTKTVYMAPSAGTAYATVVFNDINGTSHTMTACVQIVNDVSAYTRMQLSTDSIFRQAYYAFEENTNGILEEHESQITQTASNINLSVSAAKQVTSKFNKLVNSGFWYSSVGAGHLAGNAVVLCRGYEGQNMVYAQAKANSGTSNGYQWGGDGLNVQLEPNSTYTLSFFVITNNVTKEIQKDNYRIGVGVYAHGDKTTTVRLSGDENTIEQYFYISSADWTYCSFSFKTPNQRYYDIIIYAMSNTGNSLDAYFTKPMLNDGSTAMDWSLSPDDVDCINANMLSNSDVLTSNYESTGLQLGLHVNTEATTIQGGYGNVLAYVIGNSQTSDFDILEWNFKRVTDIKADTDYVLSFMAKRSSDSIGNSLWCYLYPAINKVTNHVVSESFNDNDDTINRNYSSCDGRQEFTISTEWKRYYVHWRTWKQIVGGTITEANDPVKVLLRLPSGMTNTIYIACPKLEEGCRYTQYSTNTEQLDTQIDLKEGKISMTADKFTLYNNRGEKSLGVDSNGYMEVSGVIKASAFYSNTFFATEQKTTLNPSTDGTTSILCKQSDIFVLPSAKTYNGIEYNFLYVGNMISERPAWITLSNSYDTIVLNEKISVEGGSYKSKFGYSEFGSTKGLGIYGCTKIVAISDGTNGYWCVMSTNSKTCFAEIE